MMWTLKKIYVKISPQKNDFENLRALLDVNRDDIIQKKTSEATTLHINTHDDDEMLPYRETLIALEIPVNFEFNVYSLMLYARQVKNLVNVRISSWMDVEIDVFVII